MGAACMPQKEKSDVFVARFSADLPNLYQLYLQKVNYLRSSLLFASKSDVLFTAVETYVASDTMPEDPAILAVESTHKLHPLDYKTTTPTSQWLIQACLRQHSFVMEFPFDILNYEEAYHHYVEFLYLCWKRPDDVIVPNKLADFMWHSHMQDNEKYKKDTVKMLGKILNHRDDYKKDDMDRFAKKTEEARKVLLKAPYQTGGGNVYHGYRFINYNGGNSGGGGGDRRSRSSSRSSRRSHHSKDKDKDHHDKDHHKDHHHRDKDHHHHKDHHHKDHYRRQEEVPIILAVPTIESHHHTTHTYHHTTETYHHSPATYEAPASNCGGGGGASNCGGGGGSSCGGGGGDGGGGGGGCGGGGGD